MMEKKDILIIHGTDYKNMTIRILKRAGLAELIGDRNKRIGLKPNLVVARDPSEGATTHAEILEGCHPKAADMVEFLEKEWICTHKQPMLRQ